MRPLKSLLLALLLVGCLWPKPPVDSDGYTIVTTYGLPGPGQRYRCVCGRAGPGLTDCTRVHLPPRQGYWPSRQGKGA